MYLLYNILSKYVPGKKGTNYTKQSMFLVYCVAFEYASELDTMQEKFM